MNHFLGKDQVEILYAWIEVEKQRDSEEMNLC
jgi:hypothetical protein